MAQIFEFDSFHVDTEKRLLWRGGRQIQLEPKAFEMLVVLIENRGEVVCKDELAKRVWKDVVATDDSIAQQISRLRKTLGDNPKAHRFIVTVPGVGYKFVADAREIETQNGSRAGNVKAFAISENSAAETNGSAAPQNELAVFDKEMPLKIQSDRAEDFAVSSAEKTNGKNNLRRFGNFPDRRFFAAAVFTVMAGLAAVYYFNLPSPKKTALGVSSIAVLPFKTVGNNPAEENDSLKIGMADALITRLTQLEQIKVVPTSRVSRYDKADNDPLAAGRELGVDAVLEGRFQKDGERLRVTAQLIRIADGKTLWAENYEENFSGIFDVQTAVARKVAETLALELSGDEKRALMKRYTSSPEAYRLYLEARYLWDRRSGSEARVLMRKNYQRAIELDPKFALAYVGLANMQTETPSRENYEKARVLAESALAIDENLAEAHEALGFALWRGEMNWTKAETHFRRALELNQNSLIVKQSLAMLLAWQGRFDEAFAIIDTYPAKSDIPTSAEIALYFYSRNYDKTTELSNLRLEKKPNDVNALSFLSPALTKKGMHAEAIATAGKYMTFDHVVEEGGLPYLGFAYAKAGKIEKAREILRQIERQDAPASAQINGSLAFLYGALGEKDKAFARIEKSIEAREFWAFTLKVSPQYDSLRDDPRFTEMLARLNLK